MLLYRTFLIVISIFFLFSILLLGGITVSSISGDSDKLALNDNEQIVANDQTAALIKYRLKIKSIEVTQGIQDINTSFRNRKIQLLLNSIIIYSYQGNCKILLIF